jgi:hypothetical protein
MSRLPTNNPLAPNPANLGPAWLADADHLARLRERAARRQIIRQLARGQVRKVLIQMAMTMHRFGTVRNQAGEVKELVAVLNLIELAIRAHKVILAGNPAVVTAGETFLEQDAAVAMIRSESHFDGLLMRAAGRAYLDGEAVMRADYHARLGTIVSLESNDEWLPVGQDGPDMQPTAYERRWFVPRTVNRRKVTYLRVERHRVDPVIGGIVEQEAYRSESSDPYVELSDKRLRPVPLAEAVPDATPQPLTATGLDRPSVYRLVTDFDTDDCPRLLLDESDLALFDTTAAAFSRLARTIEIHGKAKVRVSEQMIDKDGKANLSDEAIVDPDKLFEYILASFDFASLRDWAMKVQQIMMVRLGMSPALHGIRHDAGATPDTFDKLRLESTGALMCAGIARTYFEPALESLFYVATLMEARRGLNGWPVGEIDVTLHPEIPADTIDRARGWGEMLRDGLVDEEYAIRRVHGDGAAPGILRRLNEGRSARAAEAAASMFGAPGLGGPFGPTPNPADPTPPAPPAPPVTGDAA